jgi:hypothetical protein
VLHCSQANLPYPGISFACGVGERQLSDAVCFPASRIPRHFWTERTAGTGLDAKPPGTKNGSTLLCCEEPTHHVPTASGLSAKKASWLRPDNIRLRPLALRPRSPERGLRRPRIRLPVPQRIACPSGALRLRLETAWLLFAVWPVRQRCTLLVGRTHNSHFTELCQVGVCTKFAHVLINLIHGTSGQGFRFRP